MFKKPIAREVVLSQEIVRRRTAADDSFWNEVPRRGRGKRLDTVMVGKLLSQYRLGSKTVRLDEEQRARLGVTSKALRGYTRLQLVDLAERYVTKL